MGRALLLVVFGAIGIVVGLPLYGSPDPWTRSWALIALQAGSVFFAVGLGASAIVDAIRHRREAQSDEGPPRAEARRSTDIRA